MTVAVCRPAELGETEIAAWHTFQLADGLGNPFLSPEFACAVGEIFANARIAVVHDGSELTGFLPFSLARLRSATGIGGHLANCHAYVSSSGNALPIPEVVRAAGVDVFEFHALVPPVHGPLGRSARRVDALTIDLSAGVEEYFSSTRLRAGKSFKELERKRRRLERDHPDGVRFRFAESDGSALARVAQWKSAQYRRTGRPDLLAQPGVRALIELLAASVTPAMSGTVSSLTVDGRVVAADLSLRSTTVLAGWLSSYDTEVASWSPGAIATLHLIEAAAAAGLSIIDMATGDEAYKQRLSNASVELASGWIGTPSLGLMLRRTQHAPVERIHRYITSHPRLRAVTRDGLRRYGSLRSRPG